MALVGDITFHEGCDYVYCKHCQKANGTLGDIIEAALGKQYDRLGQYHTWLKKQDIQPETDGGWWSKEALTEANVNRFIAEMGDES